MKKKVSRGWNEARDLSVNDAGTAASACRAVALRRAIQTESIKPERLSIQPSHRFFAFPPGGITLLTFLQLSLLFFFFFDIYFFLFRLLYASTHSCAAQDVTLGRTPCFWSDGPQKLALAHTSAGRRRFTGPRRRRSLRRGAEGQFSFPYCSFLSRCVMRLPTRLEVLQIYPFP